MVLAATSMFLMVLTGGIRTATSLSLSTMELASKYRTKAATGTYFKLVVNDNTNKNYWCMGEIEFYDATDTMIPTTGTGFTYEAASCGNDGDCTRMNGYGAGAAFSGQGTGDDYCSNWNIDHGWLKIGFPSAVTVAKIRMRPDVIADCPTDFVMQVSSDGDTWIDTSMAETAYTWTGVSYWILDDVVTSAQGDPHLQNLHGERFDLMKPGRHVLIAIPRGTGGEDALLYVQADAHRIGGQCADTYFRTLNITGAWAETKRAGGFSYSAQEAANGTQEWVPFGPVYLKVANGRAQSGTRYLNFYAKHLGQAGRAVGGLLGEDDHEDVTVTEVACAKRVSLKKLSVDAADARVGSSSASSIGAATLD